MAGRSKKSAPPPVVEADNDAAGLAATMPDVASGEPVAAGDGGLDGGFDNPQQFMADGGEVEMSSNMEFTAGEEPETGTSEAAEPYINLDANLSIQNVVKLYDKLKRAYAAHDAIEIDASHVASVDTATLQLFVALKKDAEKQQKKVDFFQPSDRFLESARLLDLVEVLELVYV